MIHIIELYLIGKQIKMENEIPNEIPNDIDPLQEFPDNKLAYQSTESTEFSSVQQDNDDDSSSHSHSLTSPTDVLSSTETIPYFSVISKIRDDLSQIKDHNPEEFVIDIPPLPLSSNLENNEHINVNDILKPPDLNELDSLSKDAKGGLKKLNQDQLNQIRSDGKFVVPSERFPSQYHEWDIHNFVQKGKKDTLETFQNGVSMSTKQFVIYIPNRLWRKEILNLWEGLKTFLWVFLAIPIQLFGWIQRINVNPSVFEKGTIREEILHDALFGNHDYLTTSRIVKQGNEKILEVQTLDGFTISLKLAYFKPIRERLQEPYRKFINQWELNGPARRQALAKELSTTFHGISMRELSQEVVNEEAKRKQEAIYSLIHSVLNSPVDSTNADNTNDTTNNDNTNNSANNNDAADLCSLMNSIGIIRDNMCRYRKKKENAIHIYVSQLKLDHPILSRIAEWVDRKRIAFSARYDKINPVTKVTSKWVNMFKGQELYLFNRNNEIEEQVSEKIKEKTKKEPGKTFEWSFRIWLPSHWNITKNTNGSFSSDKYNRHNTSTNYPGWRIVNICIRIFQYLNNGLYHTISNFGFGPFGFRSWVGIKDYQPDRRVNSQTGKIEPAGTKYATWIGRINNIWTHIGNSRRTFEAEPDTGFFGKSFTRPFNCIWNYVFKGFFGTLFAFFGHIFLGILNIIMSVLVIATSPVWAIVGALSHYLFDLLIYDFDAPMTPITKENNNRESRNRKHWFPLFQIIIIDLLILGLGQIILAPLVAICHAIIGLLGYGWCGLRYGCRSFWDIIMYHCVIKHFGRVPDRDGFLARRTKGPGLSMSYYQIIKKEFAILLLHYQLEKEHLSLFKKAFQETIDTPSIRLQTYYNQFSSVGLVQNNSNPISQSFQRTKSDLYRRLDNEIDRHFNNLLIRNNQNVSSKVRLTKEDLKATLIAGASICSEFCMRDGYYLTPYWWNAKNLVVNDFEGLSVFFLKQAFGESILQPIEDTDKAGFRINIDHADFPKYVKMIYSGRSDDFQNDLEQITWEEPLIPNDHYPKEANVCVVTLDNIAERLESEETKLTLWNLEKY